MLLIFENNQWVEYSQLLPISVNDKKDETLDNAVVYRLTKEKKVFKPLTKVKLIDEEETHWIIESCHNKRLGRNAWHQELRLIEPIELTKGYILDNVCITQPLTPDTNHPIKTLKSEIERLIKIAVTHRRGESNKDLSTIIKLASDPRLNIQAPEESFTENTLFDALIKLGLFIDSVPKLRFNSDNTMTLFFEPLDIENKTNYNIDKLLLEEQHHSITNYSDQIVSHLYNAISKKEISFPNGENLGTKIVTEGNLSPTDLNFKNGFIKIPAKFKMIKKFELRRDKDAAEGWQDFSDFIYEYGEWQLLSPLTINEDGDLINNPLNKRQHYTVYYKINEDKIYFGDRFLNPDIIEKLVDSLYWLKDFLNIGIETGFVKTWMQYRITFYTMTDSKIKFGNDSIYNFSTIANQDGNDVDAVAYGRKINTILKRMKHGDYIVSKRYKKFIDIPEAGHLVNNKYVITNVSYIKYNGFYDVTLELSEDYVRRSEYVKEKQEIRSWEIPADKVSDRFINYKETMSLSFYKGTKRYSTSVKQPRWLFPILHFFEEEYREFNKHPGLLAGMIFSCAKLGQSYGIMTTPLFSYTDDSLIINLHAHDNTVYGHRLIDAGTKHFLNGITYTDEYGEFKEVEIALSSTQTDNITREVFKEMPNATSQMLLQLIEDNPVIHIPWLVVLKDSRETFKLSYQFTVEGNDGLVIMEDFYAYNSNTMGWYDHFVPHMYFLNKKINKEDKNYQSAIIKSIPIIKTKTVPVIDEYTYYIDKTQVPDNFAGFAIGVKDNGKDVLLLVQNDSLLKNQLKNGEITLYGDF